MAGKQTVTVEVDGDTGRLERAFSGLGRKLGLDRLGGAARKLGGAVATGAKYGALAIGALGVVSGKAASDLEQSVGGVAAVFEKEAGAVGKLSETADRRLGLTKDAYNGFASIVGTQLKAAGIPMDELSGRTDKLITRSADLAATFGGTVPDATEAMSSALRGEFEPLRRYGVSLSVADIEARALADTGKTVVTELTKQEKALATQALIMDQSSASAGQFARENDTLAGKIERIKAVGGNLAAELGTILLPMLTLLAGYLLDNVAPALQTAATWAQNNLVPALAQLGAFLAAEVVPRLQQFGGYIAAEVIPRLQQLGAYLAAEVLPRLQQFGAFLAAEVVPRLQQLGGFIVGTVIPALVSMGQWVQSNTSWLIPLAGALLAGVVAFQAVAAAMRAWRTVIMAVRTAQLLLNLALLANPIGIVIAIVAALVAGLVIAWNTNDRFRNALTAAWRAILAAVKGAWSWLSGLAGRFSDMMNRIQNAVQRGILRVIVFFTQLPGKARSAAASLTSKMSTLASDTMSRMRDRISSGIDRVLGFFRRMPGRIVSSLGNLGSTLSGAGRQIIDGFIGSITAGFDRVKRKLGQLTNLLPDWKGPPSKDRRLLTRNGQLVIGSLIRGLDPRLVKRHLQRLTRDIADTTMPTLGVGVKLAGAGGDVSLDDTPRAATVVERHYHIDVRTLQPSAEVGRSIVQSLREHERMTGGTPR